MSDGESLMLSAEERVRIDSHSRNQALEVTASCIVQAPAGSGKTELLIQRVLALLATVDAPEEIVAITFTRKAAAEMRVRIIDAITGAGSSAPEAEHARLTWTLARDVIKRDAEKGWQLLDQPSRLRIMTIDAFNGWLVRQMPWITAMGSQVGIVDDARELYRDAVRSVILGEQTDSGFRRQLTRFLVHVDNRYYLAESLLVEMLAIRDQWIPVLFSPEDAKSSARERMEGVLQLVIQRHLSHLLGELPRELITEIVELAHHAAIELRSMEDLSEEAPLRCFVQYCENPGDDADSIPVWLGIAHLLLTGAGVLRSPRGVNKRLGFIPGDPQKERLQEVLTRLGEYGDWCDRLAGVRMLPAAQYNDGQWRVLDDILNVLLRCLEELQRQFALHGVLDHQQMAFAATEALGEELDPSDLALIMEYRLRHLLVDEFQDTSSTQFRLLQLLTTGWTAEDGHTLFLVGDPMQSIYRFREAEVGLFLTVWEQQRLGAVPLQALQLYRNFRSQEGLVEWVNDTFSSSMPLRNDPDTGAVAFVAAAAQIAVEEHDVSFHVLFDGNREEEAERVAALCRQSLDSPAKYGETTAILVRSRRHVLEILPQLRKAGMRYQAVDIEALGRHPAVQDILALARALTHPGDRVAWLAVLYAPWCGLDVADLHALAAPDARVLLQDVIMDDNALTGLSAEGKQRLIGCREALQNALNQKGRKPLRRQVEGCWIELGGPATTDAAGLDAAHGCLDLLESLSHAGAIPELETLYREMEQLYAPPDPQADGRLQIMTIHKAKGLQFDTVIVPRLDGRPRNADRRLLLWMELQAAEGVSFVLAPLAPRGEDEEQTYRHIRSTLAQKDEHEDMRLLYVAATRAKRRLLLTATLKEKVDEKQGVVQPARPARNSFLGAIWDAVESEISRIHNDSAQHDTSDMERAAEETESSRLLRRLRYDWARPEIPPAAVVQNEMPGEDGEVEPSAWKWRAGTQARERGVVVHQLLALIGKRGLSWWEAAGADEQQQIARTILAQNTGNPQELDISDVLLAVKCMLSDERGRWILQPHHDVRCEYALTGVLQGKLVRAVLDRTFVDAQNERWIIDYKISGHEGSNLEAFIDMQVDNHREQLQRYAALLRKREDRPVHAALYFPLQKAWRVLIQGNSVNAEQHD